MKLFIILLTISLLVPVSIAQVKTEETKTTVDVETGDTVLTESVTISTEEDITPRSQMIVVNPLKFLVFYNLSYFHKISDNMVFGGGFQIPTLSGIDGFGINSELRIYPKGKNLRGFYFAPNISYNHIETGNISTSPFSAGILIGWQWFPGTDFALGLGIGVDYYFGSFSDDNDNDNLGSYDGASPALRFDIGYAW
jgi:hypothetical protein